MKKKDLYIILIISAIINIITVGVLKYAIEDNKILPIIFVILLAILIFNIKKIKYDTNNIYLIDYVDLMNSTIIGLIVLGLILIIYSLVISIKFSIFSITKIFFLGITTYYIYLLYLLYKEFTINKDTNIIIKIEEEKENNYLNSDIININKFTYLGNLSYKLNPNIFIYKEELNISKSAFKKFPPILVSKKYNKKNEILLKYTNKNQLLFTVFIDNTSVFIKFNKKHFKERLIGNEVLKILRSYN